MSTSHASASALPFRALSGLVLGCGDEHPQQIPLDEESKKIVVINTHKGLFAHNHLPFEVSAAPAIFQRTIESILQGIPNVCVYLDDILVTGRTR